MINRFIQWRFAGGTWGLIGLCLPLWVAATPAAPVQPTLPLPAAGVQVAPVDVVANVRRMLEQSRQQQPPAPVPNPAVPPVPATPPPSVPAPSAAAPLPVDRPASPAESTLPTQPLAVSPASRSQDEHVPLPNKVITIRDSKDIRGLANELEKAKERQQRARQR